MTIKSQVLQPSRNLEFDWLHQVDLFSSNQCFMNALWKYKKGITKDCFNLDSSVTAMRDLYGPYYRGNMTVEIRQSVRLQILYVLLMVGRSSVMMSAMKMHRANVNWWTVPYVRRLKLYWQMFFVIFKSRQNYRLRMTILERIQSFGQILNEDGYFQPTLS